MEQFRLKEKTSALTGGIRQSDTTIAVPYVCKVFDGSKDIKILYLEEKYWALLLPQQCLLHSFVVALLMSKSY